MSVKRLFSAALAWSLFVGGVVSPAAGEQEISAVQVEIKETVQAEIEEAAREVSEAQEPVPFVFGIAEISGSADLLEETALSEAMPEEKRDESDLPEAIPEEDQAESDLPEEMMEEETLSEAMPEEEQIESKLPEEMMEEAALSEAMESETAGDEDSSAEEFVISDLAINPVATNEKYIALSFHFMQEEAEYVCMVTGLEETAANEEEGYQLLAEDIARSFLAGEIFTLSSETSGDRYHLELDLIDAEKTNVYTGDDHYICWAASAADMLEFAGWNADANTDADEDEIFQMFREEFSDLGGYQTMGIGWYVDGVNPKQYTYQSSGNIAYGQNLNHGASQQQHSGTGGYWKEYAAAQIAPDTGAYDDVAGQLENAADRLEEGYGVGLGAYFYNEDGMASSGHALSVFGFVKEIFDLGVSALRALFISDSDDRAKRETTDPANRPNEYVMYTLGAYDNGDESGVMLVNYPSSQDTVIGIVTTLQPEATAEKETGGTGDATRSPNLVPSDVRVTDAEGISLSRAEAGDVIKVETDLQNQSYQGLPEGSCVRYRVNVYRDGLLVDRMEQTMTVGNLRANHGTAGTVAYIPAYAGEYTFVPEVLEITNASGAVIQEAYLNDNQYLGLPRRLTVTGLAAPEKDNPDQQEEGPAETEEGGRSAGIVKPDSVGEKIYELTVVLATDTEYALSFDAKVSGVEDFLRLQNRTTGKIVDAKDYQITRVKQGFMIRFTNEFIRTLKPGRNDFVLTWETGRVLLRITVL